MAGSRRTQRGIRVSIAAALVVLAAVGVGVAVLMATLVSLAAGLAVVAGSLATRIVYSELLQTRRDSARTCAEQARSFQQSIGDSHREHRAFRQLMTGRVLERDLAVSRLSSALRAAERRAADAESRAAEAAGRARQESRRAEQTRLQLSRLLDEVFGTVIVDEDVDLGRPRLSSVQRAG